MAISKSATLRPRTASVLAIVLTALTHSSAFAQQAANGNAAAVATANQADSNEAADVAQQLANPIANLAARWKQWRMYFTDVYPTVDSWTVRSQCRDDSRSRNHLCQSGRVLLC